LISNNILSKPISIEVKLNGQITNGQMLSYSDTGFPTKLSEFEPFHPSPTYTTSADYTYYPNNRLKEILPRTGVPTTYFWGFDDRYIVAEVEGMDHTTVISYYAPNQSLLDNAPNESQLLLELGNLRNALSNTMALVTTYTFFPLIGMTSQTDTNSQTTWFYYDSNGRLSLVKDQNGDIVKKYEYNYVVK
jgi:YD repeat-containing protein